MFQSTRSVLYHFYTAASDLNQVNMDLLSGFGPFSRGLAFSLNFPKLQGVRISSIHHKLQLQPTCGLQNANFRNSSGELGGAGNYTQNLSCCECIKIFRKMILN